MNKLDSDLLEAIRWVARAMPSSYGVRGTDADVVMARARQALHQLMEERALKNNGAEIDGLKRELHEERLKVEELRTQLARENEPIPNVLDGAFAYTMLDVERIEAHRGRPYARLRATVMSLNLCGDKIRKALDDVDSAPFDHLRQRVGDSLRGIVRVVPPPVDTMPGAEPPMTVVVDVVAAASPSAPAEIDF